MNDSLSRREFLSALGVGAVGLAVAKSGAAEVQRATKTKTITASAFEFQHHATVEGPDWNPDLTRFTAAQWEAKIKEIADAGIEYLVLMATALYYRSFYDSVIFPKWQLACPDPLEAVLEASDRYKVKFFIGCGFYGDWQSANTISNRGDEKRRLLSLEEVQRKYGHHRSFYGWYWPDEACLNPRFSPEYIRYVNTLSHEARQVTPKAPIMIAPYGTRIVPADDEYVRQLDALDVDLMVYQDEVGVRKSTPDETPVFYERLRKAHDRAQRARIWADVEIFDFEGEVYKSALVPAPFERVARQLEAVSPWVDNILVYQYLGMMNQPSTTAFAGSPASVKLYTDYHNWRKSQS